MEVADPRLQRAWWVADGLLGGARASLTGGSGTPKVYADTDWYVERPEQEREWRGVLYRRERGIGPDTRNALTYALVTSDREFDVYAAQVDAILAPLDGLQVIAEGKLVDLSREGRGAELWLASVDRAPRANRDV